MLERVRVLFHGNGYTKVMLEGTEGLGLADGGIVWDIPTDIIPRHLRQIGSHFMVRHIELSSKEENISEPVREVKIDLRLRKYEGQKRVDPYAAIQQALAADSPVSSLYS